MRVLIVTNMYPDAARPYNGIFIAEQVSAVRKLHPDIDFDICFIDGAKGKLEYLKSISYVNRKIRNGGYDLVHIHFGLSGMYLLSPFTAKIPTLVTFHGSDIQPASGSGVITVGISRQVAKTADACITLNAEMDRMVRRLNRNTFVVPCAVDTVLFRPDRATQAHKPAQIVFPCNHEMEVKNYPLFCKVLDTLRSRYGVDCEEKELAGLSRKEVARLFNKADLLLMTSRSEGSPQAVKEAMACNLPVVSTPVGDVMELLDGVKDSYVAKSHDAEELAELAARALAGGGNGLTGNEKVRLLRLDTESVANRIYDIYLHLVSYR